MAWADAYIKKLLLGETVSFRPHGNSMEPRIKSGQLVTVVPVKRATLGTPGVPKIGDAVLCQVGRAQYLHLVKRIVHSTDPNGYKILYQIGNAHGRINGWTPDVYGIVTKVEP